MKGIFAGLFNDNPTVPNDLKQVLDNASGVIGSQNVIEANLADAVLADVTKMTSSEWAEIMGTYLGAGEVAFGLSGTLTQKETAAITGADQIYSSEGGNPTLIPQFVKCALVHSGFAFASNAVKTQVTEALTLAVTA